MLARQAPSRCIATQPRDKPARMPWIQQVLRGQRVIARCELSGALRLEDGRVEIRYKPTDAKSYRAYPTNLQAGDDFTIHPDTYCKEASAEPPAAGAEAGAKVAKKTASKKSPAKSIEVEGEPDGKTLTVYADGACSGNPGPAGAGVVIYDTHGKRELSEYVGHGTNNVAELTAILRAAEALVGETRPIVLKTDSQYSIGVLTKNWKAKANPELIAATKIALAKVPTLKLRYIEGHAGHAGNERADELARNAVSARKSTPWKLHKKLDMGTKSEGE